MRSAYLLIIGLWALFTFSACGDMLNSLRRESREVDQQADRDRDTSSDVAQADDGNGNGNGNGSGNSNGYRARTLNGLSANNVADYQAPNGSARSRGRKLAGRLDDNSSNDGEPQAYHRVTRDDFVDKANGEGSLWDGQGQNNYLFTNNRRREAGDVVTVDVEKELRREIQYQLWMGLSPEQRRTRRPSSMANTASDSTTSTSAAPAADGATSKPPQGPEAKAKDAAEEAAKTNMAPAAPGDDVVRMEVVENMGNGLMRVLGQKRVVYRGVSRVVEVAALINNKDIDDGAHAKSSNFLDMKAQVIQ